MATDVRPGGQFTAMERPAKAKSVTMAVKRMLVLKLGSREKKTKRSCKEDRCAGFDSVDRSVAYILSSPADLSLRVGIHVSARRVGIVQGCKTGKYQVLILERVE